MANSLTWGGNPNSTSSYTVGAEYFQTAGLAFPTGNPDLNGTRRVYVYSCAADYVSGGTGNYTRIVKDSVASAGGRWFTSGGTFAFRVGHASGTQYVGRNTASSPDTTSSYDGRTFAGPICGSMSWATYPTAPRTPVVTRNGRSVTVAFTSSASNGGATVSRYEAQYSTDGGDTWQGTTNNGTTASITFPDLAPGSYMFRVYAVNTLGDGAAVETATVVVPAGGKRGSGGAFQGTQIARRFNGTTWSDLTIAKRYAGTAFIDLS